MADSTRQRAGIAFIVVVTIVNLYFGPGAFFAAPTTGISSRVAEQKRELATLDNSTYGDFNPDRERWLPIPGFTKDAGFAWGMLNPARARAREMYEAAAEMTKRAEQGRKTEITTPSSLSARSMASHATGTDTGSSDVPPLPIYRNISGTIRGEWVRWPEAESRDRPHMNLTALVRAHDYFSTRFMGNMTTSKSGFLTLEMYDANTPDVDTPETYVRGVRASMHVERSNPYLTDYYADLHGIHVPETGEMVLTTTSEKFSGLVGLPHFTTSQAVFDATQQLLNRSLSYATEHAEQEDRLFFPWYKLPNPTDYSLGSLPGCEYILYMQQHPAKLNGRLARSEEMLAIEKELAEPTGAPVPSPPYMTMSAIIISPDCGFALQSKSPPDWPPGDKLYVTGPKREHYQRHVERFLLLLAAVYAVQGYFLQQHIKQCSTPSKQCRASYFTFAVMSLGDGLALCWALLFVSGAASSLVIATTAYTGFAEMAFLGLKAQVDLWQAHAPERHRAAQEERQRWQRAASALRERQAERLRAANGGQAAQQTPEETSTTDAVNAERNQQDTSTSILPAPVTSPAVFIPSDQDITQPVEDAATATQTPATQAENATVEAPPSQWQDSATMYYRFYFTLSFLFLLTAWTTVWPPPLAYAYGYTVTFAYLSFWVPQIYRNAMRNCRRALTWDFVAGESLARLFMPVYVCAVPGNIYYAQPNYVAAASFVLWVWVQICLLVGQDLIGPRFFVPKGWAPPVYNYHPILRDDSADGSGSDVEAGDTLPLGYLRADEREPSPRPRASSVSSSSPLSRKVCGTRHLFDCSICMQAIEVPVSTVDDPGAATSPAAMLKRRQYMVTPCRHIFHTTCLESWMGFRLQCPICRETIPAV
ncbi:hypothetical protein KEM52_004966 [Ascosphaera acerosa]|nr:hypothetical protein KEM52_004966 [Ascosphaera acerosa]